MGYLWAIERGATQILDIEDGVRLKGAGLAASLAGMEHYTYNTTSAPFLSWFFHPPRTAAAAAVVAATCNGHRRRESGVEHHRQQW